MEMPAGTVKLEVDTATGRFPVAFLLLVLALALWVLAVDVRSASPSTTPTPLASQTGPMAPARAFPSWRSRNWAALAYGVDRVHIRTIHYRAYDGMRRIALVVLPRWYGPRDDPPIPLVLSPHGRGISPRGNVRLWGNMPALGGFAVVNPAGPDPYTWGAPGQIADLARMPRIVRRALPWLRIARHRIYAIGGSMGGQETLLLVADHPHMLAGAISFDADTNLAARYAAFSELRYGRGLQQLLRREIGGTPATRPDGYEVRSPIDDAAKIAASGVPLQIWWSTRDKIVVNQADESGLLYREIRRLNPRAPVTRYTGTWKHTAEMRPVGRMPIALAAMGLIKLGTGGCKPEHLPGTAH